MKTIAVTRNASNQIARCPEPSRWIVIVLSISLNASWLAQTGHAATRVVAWGESGFGQTNVPPNLTNAVAVAAGSPHSMALRADGTVTVWGGTSFGQSNVPPGLVDVVSVAAGDGHCLAVRRNGTVVSWGNSSWSQTNVPAGLSDVFTVSGGGLHSLVLQNDGNVVAWGGNSSSGATRIPVGLKHVAEVDAGYDYNVALLSDGTVTAWGNYTSGQTNVPMGLSNVVAVASGYNHGLALGADGTVVAWGDDFAGTATVPAGLSNVVAIAAGQNHSLALKADGTLVRWGPNSGMQPGLSNVVGIAAGTSHAVALIGDGTPAFPRSPMRQTVAVRSHVVLSAGAVGKPPLQYQWLVNGSSIAGATNPTLLLPDLVPSNAGTYSVRVSNGLGTNTGVVTSLALGTNVFIMGQPRSREVPAGFAASFSVGVDGDPPFLYQWRFNGITMPEGTNATLVLPSIGLSNAGNYDVVVRHPYGEAVTSEPAQLVVLTNTASGTFVVDFDAPLPSGFSQFGVSSVGSGSAGQGNVLKLMTNMNYAFGDFVIDDFSGGAAITAFRASFDLLMGGGTANPGDGFSFNFATNFYRPSGGLPTREEGFTNGLSVSFDSWDNVSEFSALYGTNDTAPAIEAKVFARQLAFQSMSGKRFDTNPPAGPLLTNLLTGQPLALETEPPAGQGTMTTSAPVIIELKLDGSLWVTYRGVLVLSNVQTFFPPITGGKFALAARTGAATENVWIDNLTMQTFTNARPLVFTTADPVNQRLDVGRPATFQAQVFGTFPIALQWYSNDVAIVGETNSTHITPPATVANHGDIYRIEASNEVSSVSRSAVLALQPVVFLTDDPISTMVLTNQTATFRAAVDGSRPIALQWHSNDVAIAGATNSTHTTPPAATVNNGDIYRLDASNAVNSISRSATLFIPTPPAIGQGLTNQTVVAGDNVTFTVTVTNLATLPIGYSWRRGGAPFTNIVLNSRTCSLTLFNVHTNLTAGGPGQYRVVATNAGSVPPGVTSVATLSVLPATAPSAITLAASALTPDGATLNASVNPMGAQTVAWFDYGLTVAYGNRTAVSPVGNASNVVAFNQALTGLLAGTNYHYRVVATNYGGMAVGADVIFQTTTSVAPPIISAYELLGTGHFRLRFDAAPGSNFSVLVSTNLNGVNDWIAVGPAAELTPGHFEFIDAEAAGYLTRFYQLRSP